MTDKKTAGNFGEEIACEYIKSRGMKIIKRSMNGSLQWISSAGSSFISLKSISKCSDITGFMLNTTSKRKTCVDVFQKKNDVFFCVILIGVPQSLSLSDTILYAVNPVALPCWFWKFTTKKLHYLNDIERLCVLVNSMNMILSL